MSYFNERVFKTIPIDSFEDLKKYMRRCHAFVIDNEEYYPRLVSRDKNNGQWMVKAVCDKSPNYGIWITYDEILNSNNPYFVYYIDEYENGNFRIEDLLDNVINENVDDKILYIIRGVPGSGKSTLAKTLTKNVVEADQFMYEDGEYKWKPEKLHMAHQKCQETVEQYMQEGRDKIAVANTFIKLKDIKPYIDLAKQYDYKIVVKECDGGFQNVHNVPDETVNKMKSKFQPYIEESVEEKIIAYHGSQHKKFNFRDDKVLYLTTNKEKAISYAKREWDEGLIEGEVPVVYTFEVSVKNPYKCHTENEFQSEFCDVNMNEEGGKEDLIEKGYDSIKYQDLIGVFSSSQFKLVDTEVLPPSLDYYYPKDTKYGDEDINDYYYDEEEMKESKQLTESILYDDLAYNDWNEKYEQLTVIANPSIDWLRNQLNRDDCYGFRFLHNTERNKLYVWDCKQPWMHQQVFDMVDMDWGKPGTNVIGIFEPDCVAVWEELADDGEASSSIKLAKKLDGKLFKQLYPNGYQITTCC